MEKRYIVDGYSSAQEIMGTLENNYNLYGTPDAIDNIGVIYEVTIKRVGVARQKFEVELDSSES